MLRASDEEHGRCPGPTRWPPPKCTRTRRRTSLGENSKWSLKSPMEYRPATGIEPKERMSSVCSLDQLEAEYRGVAGGGWGWRGEGGFSAPLLSPQSPQPNSGST
ncbi:unnamed protein product [Pleuronectes platessa]|uniref:Uncharacterized protein n=1 Tax=Pleuronectes platessa TaxID=8262 RepID=A0A9N7UTN1_PLEPL|nr:unnamed protein product [Pleuronectes platessa]